MGGCYGWLLWVVGQIDVEVTVHRFLVPGQGERGGQPFLVLGEQDVSAKSVLDHGVADEVPPAPADLRDRADHQVPARLEEDGEDDLV